MNKLGLIGGTGVESTIMYYRYLAYGVKEKLKKEFLPNLSIESLSVFKVLNFCENKDYEGLTRYLLKGIENLKACGCEYATFTGITPHIVFEEVAKLSPLPLISIIEASKEHALKQGFKKIALFATKPTMSGDFFQKPFERSGIEVLLPNEAEKEFIGRKIKDEIEHGIIKNSTKAEFIDIANRLISAQNVNAIVLGCTELPLLFNDVKLDVPFIDVMQVHIDELISIIMQDKSLKIYS